MITKIIKLNENNQYGFAVTQSMPTGCLKENEPPSWLDFNILLETVALDDPIGHLFIVDIYFGEKIATEKQWLYNEIFPPIIKKQNS